MSAAPPLELVATKAAEVLIELTDATTGEVLDLSPGTTSVTLSTRLVGATDKATVTCTKRAGKRTASGTIDETAPYDVAGAGGICIASLPDTTFPAAGRYEGEIEVTYASTGHTATPYELVRFVVRAPF